MNKKLDGMPDSDGGIPPRTPNEFRNKQMENEYPVMRIDAVYEKIRFDNSINSMAVMIIKDKRNERESRFRF